MKIIFKNHTSAVEYPQQNGTPIKKVYARICVFQYVVYSEDRKKIIQNKYDHMLYEINKDLLNKHYKDPYMVHSIIGKKLIIAVKRDGEHIQIDNIDGFDIINVRHNSASGHYSDELKYVEMDTKGNTIISVLNDRYEENPNSITNSLRFYENYQVIPENIITKYHDDPSFSVRHSDMISNAGNVGTVFLKDNSYFVVSNKIYSLSVDKTEELEFGFSKRFMTGNYLVIDEKIISTSIVDGKEQITIWNDQWDVEEQLPILLATEEDTHADLPETKLVQTGEKEITIYSQRNVRNKSDSLYHEATIEINTLDLSTYELTHSGVIKVLYDKPFGGL